MFQSGSLNEDFCEILYGGLFKFGRKVSNTLYGDLTKFLVTGKYVGE